MGKSKELAELGDVVTQDGGNMLVGTTGKFDYSGGTTEITVGTATSGATAGGAVTFVSNNGATTLGYAGFQESEAQIGTMGSRPLKLTTDNLARVTIDASGRVTMPYQPAAFAAKDNGGGWSTVSGIMVFNDVKLNRGNCYNSSTGIFTCPAAGVYRVHAEALTGDVSTSCQVYIHKNGSAVTQYGAHSNYQGATYYTIGTEALVDCAANDQLSVVMTSGSNAIYTAAEYTKATFMMVG